MRLQRHLISLAIIALVGESVATAAFGENPSLPVVSRVEVVLSDKDCGGAVW